MSQRAENTAEQEILPTNDTLRRMRCAGNVIAEE
jgi:hypothetical protein